MKTMKMFEKKTGKRLLGFVSIFLAQTLLLSGAAFALPQQDTAATAIKEVVTDPGKIVIPGGCGIVRSSSSTSSGRLVIHIQDVHCNYEAQSNIAKIIESLIKNYGVSFVAVEGASGTMSTSWFKAFPDEAVRKEVADYFMRKGEITGPEFLAVTASSPVKLFGVETRSYYLQNLDAFKSSYPFKAETEKHLNSVKADLEELKNFIYSDELRLVDAKSRDYGSGKVQLNDYARFLQAASARHNVDLRQFEELARLVDVLAQESRVDFNAASKERVGLIDELNGKLSKAAVIELVTQSISFKIGKISPADYYHYLAKLAADNAVDLSSRYPSLCNYITYSSEFSKINSQNALSDIRAAEAAVKTKLFENDDQRALEKLSRHVDILIGLINIRLVNADFNYYMAHKDEFTGEAFTGFIARTSAQHGLVPRALEPQTDAVASTISKLEDFYTIAIKRDEAFVENTLNEMDRQDQRIAILVTGGFHSEGITRLFEKENISYLVISPSVTKDAPTPYIQVLTSPKTSFDEIVIGAARE